MRQIAMQSSGDKPNSKRQKHKHKCGDTLCKHRKHKKRRKHKKHHHRANENTVESSTNAAVKKESNDEDDYDDEDSAQKSSDSLEEILLAKNNLTKTVNIKINKLVMKDHDAAYRPIVKEEGSTEGETVSSATEDSSGSSYVRNCLLYE